MNRHSLHKQTLSFFIIIVLFFGMMFAISAIIISNNANREYRNREALTVINNVDAAIEGSINNYNYLTRLLMIDEDIVAYLKSGSPDRNMEYEARRGIYSIQNLYTYIDSIFIFRNDGVYVGTERNLYYIDTEGEGKQSILEAKGTTLVSANGNGMLKKSTDERLLTLSRAIYDFNSQKLIGILVMNISEDYFEDTIISQNDNAICIFDYDGEILCGDTSLLKQFDEEDFWEEDNVLLSEHGGRVVAKSNRNGALYILCSSGGNANVVSKDIIIALLLTLAAFALAILAWGIFIRKNVVRPISKLSDAMEKTKSSGWLKKLDAKMPGNEWGMLADSYNTMIEYLNELFVKSIENEKSVRRAEMRVLQEQIKPHFLYNTIETISYLALQENATKAQDALEHLGSFYRNFLSKGSREIPVKTEVQITKDYLSLQMLRYGEAFTAEYEIDDAALECLIPKLILQPLVENAIYHGVRPKGDLEVIRVKVKLENEELIITVYDSGVGMEQKDIDKVLSEEVGSETDGSFGLAGTLSRIRYFCGGRETINIRSELWEYTEIEIRMPAVWKEEVKGE